MSSAETEHEKAAGTGTDPAAAVLYVCAERGTVSPGLAAGRAEEEGHAFAATHGLRIVEVVGDPYGEPDPRQREGWRRIRAMAETGAVGVVVVRWPAVIAPESAHELRYHELRWLREHGVRVRYSWPPLLQCGADR
ncbi:recombinase family protein [Streptomyces zingiberis]|uniref:Recombinase family protein n=1 Tax=Streptomyces zingiberis TaxID=2053010 RepID=A0ABX1BXK0_9ACTN|nr:recombinase family protein [Streptomyces zingiberis]NJQ01196.1 recombinase family protein [Streptomyces zingiberis]